MSSRFERLVLERLDNIEGLLCKVLQKENILMALSAEVRAVLTQLDTATNEVATRIDALIAANATNAELVSALTPVADRLRTLAKDPANPVPPVSPVPPS